MARGQLLSIIGLYNFDNTIFDNFELPEELDKDVVVNNILMECAELEILYPDADTMKFAIGQWSKMRLQAWQRMADVLYTDYDPFINIKRDEERTITQTRDLANSSTLKNNVNAWDDNSANGKLRDTSLVDGTDTGTVTTHEKFHVEGDSAITDAQDVMKKEIEARDKYNIYNYIVKEFKNRFCILVY